MARDSWQGLDREPEEENRLLTGDVESRVEPLEVVPMEEIEERAVTLPKLRVQDVLGDGGRREANEHGYKEDHDRPHAARDHSEE